MASIPELQEVLNESAETRTVKASSEFMSLYQVFTNRYRRFQESLSAADIGPDLKKRANKIVEEALENAGFTMEQLNKYVTSGLTVSTAPKPTTAQLNMWQNLKTVIETVEKMGDQFAADTGV